MHKCHRERWIAVHGAAAADCLLFQIAVEMSPPLSGARLLQHMCRRPGWLTPRTAGQDQKKKKNKDGRRDHAKRKVSDIFA